MFRFVVTLTLVGLPLIASPVSAEVSCSTCQGGVFVPGPDYAVLVERAGKSPEMQRALMQMDRLREMKRSGSDGTLYQVLEAYSRVQREALQNGFPYRLKTQVDIAQQRARILSQFLEADLDGDGQISGQEIRDTLKVSQAPMAAQAFLSADLNADNLLDGAEIRAATVVQFALNGGERHNHGNNMLELVDFDDDGILTPAEIERAAAALGLEP